MNYLSSTNTKLKSRYFNRLFYVWYKEDVERSDVKCYNNIMFYQGRFLNNIYKYIFNQMYYICSICVIFYTSQSLQNFSITYF